jgi:hypothetical protein
VSRARWSRPSFGLALVITWLVAAAQARAEAARAQLTLQRPAQSFCPSADAIASDLEALTGYPVFTTDASAAARQVRCDIQESESGATARIEVRAADGTFLGTRELSVGPGECPALRGPIAVVLLMLLDQQLVPVEGAEKGSEGARSLGVGASLGALMGLLPRAQVGLGLVLMPRLGERLHARLDAGYWFPVTAQTSEGIGGSFQAFSLGGALCARILESSHGLAASLCAGTQLAVLQARAQNLLSAQREARVLGQGLLALELASRWGRSELRADLGPTLAFSRPRFYLQQRDGSPLDVHQPARLGAFFRLALIIGAP